jgi:hypothetical protein
MSVDRESLEILRSVLEKADTTGHSAGVRDGVGMAIKALHEGGDVRSKLVALQESASRRLREQEAEMEPIWVAIDAHFPGLSDFRRMH